MPLHSGLSQHRALSVFPGGQICRGRYPDGPAAILPVCRPFAVQHAAMLLSVFNSKRRPLPPQGRTRPQATPRRAAPRRPCGARAFRPRDAWAHPARRRSQPARGRRPVRGAVRSRRNKAAHRSPLRRRCCSGVYAGAGAGRLTVSPYCSSFGFAQTCFPPNDVDSF